jgi:hypothetical protein
MAERSMSAVDRELVPNRQDVSLQKPMIVSTSAPERHAKKRTKIKSESAKVLPHCNGKTAKSL